jgi:DNA modification methylase
MIRREVQIGSCRLLLGDCLEILPTIGPVDAVVTDPPYGVLGEVWDDLSTQELAALTMAWAGQARRICDTAVIFFGQKTRHVINDILGLLYTAPRQIIWSKGGGSVAADGMFFSYESAYFCQSNLKPQEIVGPKSGKFAEELRAARTKAGLSRGGIDILVRGKKTGLCYRWEEGCCLPTPEQIELISTALDLTDSFFEALEAARVERDSNVTANLQRTKDGAARMLDVLRYPAPSGIGHPTSKPVGLMMDLCNLTEGKVLDPFMGSGSTGVACAKLGRSFVGIELDETYFNIACDRIRKAYAQPDMFVERPAPPTQGALL